MMCIYSFWEQRLQAYKHFRPRECDLCLKKAFHFGSRDYRHTSIFALERRFLPKKKRFILGAEITGIQAFSP